MSCESSAPSPFAQRVAFLLLGASLAFGFIVASDKLSKAIAQVRAARPEVTVKGVATQDLTADEGELNSALTWRGTDLAAGRAALDAQREVVRRLLKDVGFAPTEIVFAPTSMVRLEPARPNATNVDFARSARGTVPDYILTASFTIRSPKVAAVGEFCHREVLLGQDVELNRGNPLFRILNFDDSKKELLEAAAKDARRRAAVLVAGSGSKVGGLLDASQGVFQVSAKGRVNESDYGSIDNSSIEKTMRLVVTMRFEIVKE
jgi:hypothetical protein